MAIVSFEWVVLAAAVVLALMLWVIHILLDVQRSIRQSLSHFEDKLILLEDDARRLHQDAHVLRTHLSSKVETHTLQKRLEGLTALLGLSAPKR